jgi:hypothetical protein
MTFMSFGSPFLPSSVIPPVIHPTSSGSWGWGQVVCLEVASMNVVVGVEVEHC